MAGMLRGWSVGRRSILTGSLCVAVGFAVGGGYGFPKSYSESVVPQQKKIKRLSGDSAELLLPKKKVGLGDKRHYTYVIVGSGTAAYTALESVRQGLKGEETVLLISDEQHMARLDVSQRAEALCDLLEDVYNEWRRHIACRLGAANVWSQVSAEGVEPAPVQEPAKAQIQSQGSVPVRKWGTRRDSDISGEKAVRVADSAKMSVLIDDLNGISIQAEDRTLTLSDGSVLHYERCLLAPPGKPRELYVLQSSSITYSFKEKMNTLKNMQDFHYLERVAKKGGQKIVVVGGGFLGTTLVAALAEMNKDESRGKNTIIQTFVESSPLQQYFPGYLCDHIEKSLRLKGIEIRPDRLVTGVQKSDEAEARGDEDGECAQVSVTLMEGAHREYLDDCDYVVLASTNVTPDVEIAKRSSLEIDPINGGIMVNSSLEAYDGLFVAGSAASYYDSVLGRRRVDFYDNALNSGLLAGQNMASEDGRLRPYVHQPTFRCVLAGLNLSVEAVGEVNSDLSTAGVWLSKRDPVSGKPLPETAFERGLVFYLKKNVVVGVACCNASECLDAARDILSEGLSFEEASRRLLLAPDQWLRVIKTK